MPFTKNSFKTINYQVIKYFDDQLFNKFYVINQVVIDNNFDFTIREEIDRNSVLK